MRIRCRTTRGAVHEIVAETDAHDVVATAVASCVGAPATPQNVRLVFRGKVLSKDEPFRKQGVNDNDTLVVLVDRQREPKPAPVLVKPPPSPPDTEQASPTEPDQKTASTLNARSFFEQYQRQRREPPRVVIPTIDPALVARLTDMGFGENRVKRALLASRLNVERAMNWLIDHSEDTNPELDQPLVAAPPPQVLRAHAPLPRARTPDPAMIQQLQEMGFSETQAREALQLTRNNYEAAANYLLGDQDPFQGIPPGFIENALQNPIIRQALTDPRMHEAFRNIMANPAQLSQYQNDPVIGPMLMNIARSLFGPGGPGPFGPPSSP